jgi:hypothetical protein
MSVDLWQSDPWLRITQFGFLIILALLSKKTDRRKE